MRNERNQMTSVPDPFQIQSLAETPNVRAEKVTRGKALIADPNYPSAEQIRAIAGLLAENMSRRKAATRGSLTRNETATPCRVEAIVNR